MYENYYYLKNVYGNYVNRYFKMCLYEIFSIICNIFMFFIYFVVAPTGRILYFITRLKSMTNKISSCYLF